MLIYGTVTARCDEYKDAIACGAQMEGSEFESAVFTPGKLTHGTRVEHQERVSEE